MGTGKKLFSSLVLATAAIILVGLGNFSSAWAHGRHDHHDRYERGNGWGNGQSWRRPCRDQGDYRRGYYNRFRGGNRGSGNWFSNNYRPGNRWGNNDRGYGGWRPGLAYGENHHYSRYRRGFW